MTTAHGPLCRSSLCQVLGFLALLVFGPGCAGEPASPAAVPPPEATPEPTPEPLRDVQVTHVRIDEVLEASHMPSLSPLARKGGATSASSMIEATTSLASIAEAGGAEPILVETLRNLEAGAGASGAQLALVEWVLDWAPNAGSARFWGLCSLPCDVDSSFVARPEHYPLDPVLHPLPMFAHRPGWKPLRIEAGVDGLNLREGELALLTGGATADVARKEESTELLWTGADLREIGHKNVTVARRIEAQQLATRSFALSERAEGVPRQIRMLPELEVKNSSARVRAVLGVTETIPWPEASRFEGGFVARPNPTDFGIKLDRPNQRILWTPTLAQSADGKAEFVTHELQRTGGVRTTVSPFPGGADVLGAVPILEGRLVLTAGRSGFEEQPQLQEAKRRLLRFSDEISLPDPVEGESTTVLYVVDHGAGLIDGSAGDATSSYSVSVDAGEEHSLAAAWARLALGPAAAVRSPAADDLALYFEELLAGGPSMSGRASFYAPVFADAGEDVLREWKFRVRGPKHSGAPDAEEFLQFVAGQLPDLAKSMRRDLALRSAAQQGSSLTQELWAFSTDETSDTATPSAPSPISMTLPTRKHHATVLELPLDDDSAAIAWTLRLSPSADGSSPRWAWMVVSSGAWTRAGVEERGTLLKELGPSLGSDAVSSKPPSPRSNPRPLSVPSQRAVMEGTTAGSTSAVIETATEPAVEPVALRAPPTEDRFEIVATDTGTSIILLVWGAGDSEVHVEFTPEFSEPSSDKE